MQCQLLVFKQDDQEAPPDERAVTQNRKVGVPNNVHFQPSVRIENAEVVGANDLV